jgi:hypothetical protein
VIVLAQLLDYQGLGAAERGIAERADQGDHT